MSISNEEFHKNYKSKLLDLVGRMDASDTPKIHVSPFGVVTACDGNTGGEELDDILFGLREKQNFYINHFPNSILLTSFSLLCQLVDRCHKLGNYGFSLTPENIELSPRGDIYFEDESIAAIIESFAGSMDLADSSDAKGVELPIDQTLELASVNDSIISDIQSLGRLLGSILTCENLVDSENNADDDIANRRKIPPELESIWINAAYANGLGEGYSSISEIIVALNTFLCPDMHNTTFTQYKARQLTMRGEDASSTDKKALIASVCILVVIAFLLGVAGAIYFTPSKRSTTSIASVPHPKSQSTREKTNSPAKINTPPTRKPIAIPSVEKQQESPSRPSNILVAENRGKSDSPSPVNVNVEKETSKSDSELLKKGETNDPRAKAFEELKKRLDLPDDTIGQLASILIALEHELSSLDRTKVNSAELGRKYFEQAAKILHGQNLREFGAVLAGTMEKAGIQPPPPPPRIEGDAGMHPPPQNSPNRPPPPPSEEGVPRTRRQLF